MHDTLRDPSAPDCATAPHDREPDALPVGPVAALNAAVLRLRAYQIDAAARIADAFAAHRRRVLLWMPTGGGKTVTFAEVARLYRARGLRVLVVAHRKELVEQAKDKLDAAGVGEVGVYRGQGASKSPGAMVHVASIQALRHRKTPIPADLVIVDEAHHGPAATYTDLQRLYPDADHLGVTATPWHGTGKGLRDCYDVIVSTTTVAALTEAGFLARARVFTHQTTLDSLDLRGVSVDGSGDFNAKKVSERTNKPVLVGCMVEHWQRLAHGAATLAFASSVEHSKSIVARFRAAGVTAEHLDGTTPTSEREAIIARLRAGETKVVSNYGVLTEGFDAPAVGCVILARPTRRLGVFLQAIGRGLRVEPGKETVLVLDHAGNCLAFGLPTDERACSLDGIDAEERSACPLKRCPACGRMVGLGVKACPECSGEASESGEGEEERAGGDGEAEPRGVPVEDVRGALVEWMFGDRDVVRAMFRGEMRTPAEIVSLSGVSTRTIRDWIAKGLDIDEMVAKYQFCPPSMPGSARAMFRGEMHSVAEIVSLSGVPSVTVRRWIRKGLDIDEMVAKHGLIAPVSAMFRGEMRAISAITNLSGVPNTTVRRWIAKGLDIDKMVAKYKAAHPAG